MCDSSNVGPSLFWKDRYNVIISVTSSIDEKHNLFLFGSLSIQGKGRLLQGEACSCRRLVIEGGRDRTGVAACQDPRDWAKPLALLFSSPGHTVTCLARKHVTFCPEAYNLAESGRANRSLSCH